MIQRPGHELLCTRESTTGKLTKSWKAVSKFSDQISSTYSILSGPKPSQLDSTRNETQEGRGTCVPPSQSQAAADAFYSQNQAVKIEYSAFMLQVFNFSGTLICHTLHTHTLNLFLREPLQPFSSLYSQCSFPTEFSNAHLSFVVRQVVFVFPGQFSFDLLVFFVLRRTYLYILHTVTIWKTPQCGFRSEYYNSNDTISYGSNMQENSHVAVDQWRRARASRYR